MKNTTLLLPWLSLFFVISLSALTANAGSTLPAVLDLDKKPLRAGVRYYILPLVRGRGGGVTLGSASENKTCPLDQIVQDPFEVNSGHSLTFSPVNTSKSGVVRESADLNIKFSSTKICGKSTVWRLGEYDETKKLYFLTTGGVEGNPGPQTISNWFKIEKFGNDYKLLFCPTVCNLCKVICKDVGIYVDNGKRRLAVSQLELPPSLDQPFVIFFNKA